ncbi:MAG: heterodisulfide reductase-related iron-sulfur binding cluster [Bacteroidota bacterium]|nr:heterodisulfide reductase-related iron-sulfur binding cluster [Bacteroidota bacterium]MDP4231783.1 heterodisulfide reductase-related iron-sulfur binding cluster [Bacteroidota bacterium]MDP4243518.1 heterodisulfide reductase-related iron-sulfur binding cluster [Bacteroidota bacterium]MDP4287120.1 heterodisulfide reductase-related iron-sulfur binding cluster [Bacteroidota bacterium]
MVFDTHDPLYWDSADLQREFTRILDVCNGCRLCDNLCPPFSDIFDRIEAEDDKLTAAGKTSESAVHHLTKADYDHTVDYCYQCKLCYPKCPYTPPHEYQLDFPRLLLRADAIKTKEHGKPIKSRLRDFVTGDTDRAGAIGAAIPGLMNWGAKNPLARTAMEVTIGIDRRKKLPEYARETFHGWWKIRTPALRQGTLTTMQGVVDEKIALFYTCMLDQNKPWIGRQYVQILEKFGIEIAVPEQECCGMPELGTGNIEKVTGTVDRNIARLLPWVEKGYKIIAMSPSCSMMMRLEYENYATDKAAAKRVMAAIFDPCEYLMKLHREKKIALEFPVSVTENVTYHVPCHLRVQNIGYNSRDLMKLIPGVNVTMVQQCSGHDGSWSAKKEYYEISLDVGKKLFKAIDKDKPATVVSDCSLAHLHIEEGTGEHALHPIEIVYRAMGLAPAQG